MTTEEKIAELLALAEPLRTLPDDEAGDLPGIVDKINALRALQAAAAAAIGGAIDERNAAELADVIDSVSAEKRGPGRPRKVD